MLSKKILKRLYTIGLLLFMWLIGSWWIYTHIEDTTPVQTVHNKPKIADKSALNQQQLNQQYFSINILNNVSSNIKFKENEQNLNNVNNILLQDDSLLTITNYEIESDSKNKLKAKNFIDDIDLMYLNDSKKMDINYIWYDSTQDSILFCIGVNTRLGNIMHEYFLAQSIAFFMQKKFEMVSPLHYKKYNCSMTNLKRNLQYFYKYKNYQDSNNKLWKQFNANEINKIDSIKHIRMNDILYSHYLPKQMDYTQNKQTSHKIKLFILNIIYYINQQPNIYDRRKPYRSVLRLLYYNPIFYYDMIGTLIIDSLDNYYLNHNMENDKPFFMDEMDKKRLKPFNKNIDYSIHFRCGDIVVGKYPYHGLLTLNYFKKIFNGFTFSKDIKVYFFTQLSSNTIRGTENEKDFQNSAEYKCNYIVQKYAQYLRKLIYPSQLIIIGAGNINDDLYKMSHSKVLICSASTFCEIAAFANTNGMVILPSNGPWKDWYFGFKVWTPNNHKFINLNEDKTLILSGLQMYGWNASKIVNYLIKH